MKMKIRGNGEEWFENSKKHIQSYDECRKSKIESRMTLFMNLLWMQYFYFCDSHLESKIDRDLEISDDVRNWDKKLFFKRYDINSKTIWKTKIEMEYTKTKILRCLESTEIDIIFALKSLK
jgi:hypothetical protein